MKIALLICVASLMITSSSVFAQPSYKEALDDFHRTLAFTYHPMIDDSNYTPIRSRSHELAEKAEALEKSFDSSNEKSGSREQAIEQLTEQCNALDDVIQKGATDAVIHQRLDAIHSKFHELESLGEKNDEK